MIKLRRVDQVAEMFEMSEDRIYSLNREEILPAIRFGRTLRWSTDTINQFIAEGGKSL